MLADGRRLRLRRIRPDDVEALRRGFARLTPDQVRQRVFHRMNELAVDVAERLCDVDPATASAYVAVDDEGEIHGEARFHLDRAGTGAEFAIAVDPAVAGLGVGRALIRILVADARRRGLGILWGSVLAENTQMLELVRHLGAHREAVADEADLVHVSFDLNRRIRRRG